MSDSEGVRSFNTFVSDITALAVRVVKRVFSVGLSSEVIDFPYSSVVEVVEPFRCEVVWHLFYVVEIDSLQNQSNVRQMDRT